MRAGQYLKLATGYTAFDPKPLPPTPPLKIDAKLSRLLSEADLALGRLDGVSTLLPNPDLFVSMYVRKEAVLSSQIEGTQSTQPVACFKYCPARMIYVASGTATVRRHQPRQRTLNFANLYLIKNTRPFVIVPVFMIKRGSCGS